MLIVKNIENNTMCNMQELCLHLVELILTKLVSSIFSLHFSTNLSTNLSLHLQFSWSKYSPTSHDLSHSHSQLLGFQIYPLWHKPLSVNSLYSHRHLSSFQRCLLLQTLASNLHSHLHLKSFTTSETHIFAYGSLILLQLPLHLLVLILKRVHYD